MHVFLWYVAVRSDGVCPVERYGLVVFDLRLRTDRTGLMVMGCG